MGLGTVSPHESTLQYLNGRPKFYISGRICGDWLLVCFSFSAFGRVGCFIRVHVWMRGFPGWGFCLRFPHSILYRGVLLADPRFPFRHERLHFLPLYSSRFRGQDGGGGCFALRMGLFGAWMPVFGFRSRMGLFTGSPHKFAW